MRFITLFCFIFLFINGNSVLNAQNYADSLISELNSKHTPTELESIKLELARELVYVNSIKAAKYALDVVESARKRNNKRSLAYAYRILSSIYAVDENYIASSEFINRSQQLFSELKDSVGIVNCYISLGHIFRRQKNIEDELYYHRKAYQFFKRNTDLERIGVTMHNFGESLFNGGKIDSAVTLTLESIKINEQLKRYSVLSSCYNVLGNIYFAQNKIVDAEVFFKKVLQISELLGSQSQKVATMQSLLHLAEIASNRNKLNEELDYLNQAKAINEIFSYPEYIRLINKRLIEYYIKTNQSDLALKHLNYSSYVNDSLNRNQQRDRSELMKSAIQAFQLENQTQLLQQTNRFQSNLLLFSLITVIIMAILISIYFRLNKKLAQSYQELEIQKKLLESQKNDLFELNFIKDKFFGIIAHDLRGPIGTALQLSQLYFDQKEIFSPEDLKLIESSFKETITNTYTLTENLISWAKVQMKGESSNPEKVLLNEVLEPLLELFKQRLEQKEIHFSSLVNDDCVLFVDKNQISFILRNLIANAIKFCSPNDSIVISTCKNYKDPDFVRIMIEDSGIGMSDEIKSRIFKIERSDFKTKGTDGERGSGLGLILCKEFTELNKGKLSFNSEVNKGTTFIVDLPRYKKSE